MEQDTEQEQPVVQEEGLSESGYWRALVVCGVSNLLAAVTISLQGPLYPAAEAERNGIDTVVEYGLVLGVLEFVIALSSAIFGKNMAKIGPKRVFSVSILVVCAATMSFGLLGWVSSPGWFIALFFIARVFEASACAALFVVTFVLVADKYPNRVAISYAFLQGFISLGLTLGLIVGDIELTYRGFGVSYFITATALLFSSLFTRGMFRKSVYDRVTETFGIWELFKIPTVTLAALSIATTALSVRFFSLALAPYLKPTGLVFAVNDGIYAISMPIWGLICYRMTKPLYITLFGNLLICASFLLIVPSLFATETVVLRVIVGLIVASESFWLYICSDIKRPVYITLIGNLVNTSTIMIMGRVAFQPSGRLLVASVIGHFLQIAGFTCFFVSSSIVALTDFKDSSGASKLSTSHYALVAGLWQSMLSLGAWVGSIAGDVFYDTGGFRQDSWLILITFFLAGLATVMYTYETPISSSYYVSTMVGERIPLLELRRPKQNRDIEGNIIHEEGENTPLLG